MVQPHNGEYSALKRKELLLIHVTTWTNIINITPSERSQTQKSTCYIPTSRKGKSNPLNDKSQIMEPEASGDGRVARKKHNGTS